MTKLMKSVSSILAAMLLLSFVSCQKENDAEEKQLKLDATDHALAEQTFGEVDDLADQAYDAGIGGLFNTTPEGGSPIWGNCATITRDTISNPRVITIDFGPVNCMCNDGKYRRGQIIITYTGRYMQAGTVITHGFNEYYVNDNHVEGSKVITNQGLNTNNNMWWSKVVNGSITKPDGGVLTWTSTREKEWIEGRATPIRRDDVFLIRGSSTGSRPDGSTFSVLITTDLRKELSCRWIVSGTMEITPANRPTRILDYGDGNCDRFATITIGNRTITIRLH
ncbi:MAG: hypothetical protein U1C46_07275 [Bacteroidales bacterium]|nr:hypothetical protein [Bacteroidales bacterium]MDZ4204604.1 hypothetical protein [Bacteroidales bacterium]